MLSCWKERSHLKIFWNRGYSNWSKTEFKEHMRVDRGTFELILNRISANIYKTRCIKSARIWSYSGPHFPPVFPHLDTYISVFSPNTGKNADQNNSKHGHFLGSDTFQHGIKSVSKPQTARNDIVTYYKLFVICLGYPWGISGCNI